MLAVAFGLVLSVHVFIRPTCSFYVPGVAPLDFRSGEHVEVKVSARVCFEAEIECDFIVLGSENDEHKNATTLRVLRHRRTL
jgi:hypothetical protein